MREMFGPGLGSKEEGIYQSDENQAVHSPHSTKLIERDTWSYISEIDGGVFSHSTMWNMKLHITLFCSSSVRQRLI